MYTDHGQRIAVAPYEGGTLMVDGDRGLTYWFDLEWLSSSCFMPRWVMKAYNNNESSIGYMNSETFKPEEFNALERDLKKLCMDRGLGSLLCAEELVLVDPEPVPDMWARERELDDIGRRDGNRC